MLRIALAPRPPIPMPRMFNLSLGEMWPWLIPRIELGAIVIPANAVAPVFRNFLLEKSDIVLLYLFNKIIPMTL